MKKYSFNNFRLSGSGLKSEVLLFLFMFLLIATGTFLRIWRDGNMLVFADEVHLLECVTSKSLSWIVSHFFSISNYIR